MAAVASKQLYFHVKLSWGAGMEGGSACPGTNSKTPKSDHMGYNEGLRGFQVS